VRVVASKVVDEANKVQEDDRSRKYRAGYWIIFWYSINAVLEPIGMVPNRVCDATVFSLFIWDKYLMAIHWMGLWTFHGPISNCPQSVRQK